MIQRIQSLYLLVVLVAYALLFFFPVASFTTTDFYHAFSITAISSRPLNPDPSVIKGFYYAGSTLPLIILVCALATAVLVTIFLFRKRILQIRITAILLLVHIALIAAMFYYADSIEKQVTAKAVYEAGAYIALIPLVFLVLANRAVRKDEKLVRSADRIR